ncbi:MAG: ABC transporter ATP-binding protein [Erysipelotrichaceae bacterium]
MDKKVNKQNKVSFGPQFGNTEKANDFKGTLKKLIKHLAHYKIAIIIVIILSIGATIFGILGPKILGNATTLLFEGLQASIMQTGEVDFNEIAKILLFLLGLYILSMLFFFIQGWVMSKVANTMTYQFRKDISKKINTLPLSYFDKTTTGDVLSRVTNDVDKLSQALNQNITQIVSSIIMLIGISTMMFSINGVLSIIVICTVPVSFVIIALIAKRSQKQFLKVQSSLGDVNGHVEEMYAGHVVVRAFNGEKKSIREFNSYNDELYKASWLSEFLSSIMMPLSSFVSNIAYVIVCILGGSFVINGSMSVGDVQAFIQYVRRFQQPISQTAQISSQIQGMIAAAERVFDFLEAKEEIKDLKDAISADNIKGIVEFENVNFGYLENQLIIKDFSVDIKAGERVAIVGPTGAGKTTIVKLLMRFYDLNSGCIKIDGIEITKYKRAELRKLFGMVLQDTWLYNGSIKDNISYSKLDASESDIIRVAKAAYVDHFIHTLPNNYDFIINEDSSNISAGQKQLLTIARAFLADPKILILDEATSSVDTRTEVLIQKAMDNLMVNRTSFIIAHRLSTIRNADKILVMKDGNIVEIGNHLELIKLNGFYANLYNSQFEE